MAKSSRIRKERIEDFAMVPQGKRPSTSRESGSKVRSHFVEAASARVEFRPPPSSRESP